MHAFAREAITLRAYIDSERAYKAIDQWFQCGAAAASNKPTKRKSQRERKQNQLE